MRLHQRYTRLERAQIGWLKTFDSIQDLILVHDNNYQVVRVNRALVERLGRLPVEAVGKTCDILLPRVAPGGTCPYCVRYLRGVEEGEDPCFGGRSVVSTSFISPSQSAPAGTIHIISDITEQAAAEERYRRLFHGIREGVFITTADGRILDCHDALVNMLGYSSRTELMQVNMWQISTADVEHRQVFEHAMATRGFVQNHEVSVRRKDGHVLTALETSFVTRDPASRSTTYQGFLIDVTETRRAEEQVRRRNHELKVLNEIASISSQSLDLDEVLNLAVRHIRELLKADTG